MTDEEIKNEAGGFFTEFMRLQPEDFEGVSIESLNNLLGFQCSESDCAWLEREVTGEETQKVIF